MLVLHKRPKRQRKYRVQHLAYSPDGRWLAGAVYRTLREDWPTETNGQLLLWDLRAPGGPWQVLERPCRHAVARVAWLGSNDPERLVAMTTDARLFLWDTSPLLLAEARLTRDDTMWPTDLVAADAGTILCSRASPYHERPGRVVAIQWSDDRGEAFLLRENVLRRVPEGVWSIAVCPGGETVALGLRDAISLRAAPQMEDEIGRLRHQGYVRHLAFSPDGQRLASAGGWRVRLWDLNRPSGRVQRELKGHGKEVTSIAWSPDGRFLLSGSLDETVRLWDTRSGRPIDCYDWGTGAVRSLAFSPDGTTAAVGGSKRDSIVVWDVEV